MKQKLIDQLIHKAGARFGGDGINYDLFVPSKFAQLIVRECLVQIGNAIPDTDCSSSGPYKTARIAATSRVKEHFGVEE